MSPIKVVIADDHTLFREGLKRIFSMEKDMLVVGEAASGKEAISAVERTHPDLLLLDLKMPEGDALSSLARIAEKSPTTKVMILTAYSEDQSVRDSAKGRARAYVLKGVSTPTLLEAMRKVHRGEVWVDPELAGRADFTRLAERQSFEPGPPANETLQALTKRELEILHLVAQGLTNDEIGKKIFISEKTVKTHLANIFDKLQVNNRFKAALLVMHQPSRHSA
jgi:DNA-binding NarL/FixJ family response regulator